MDFLNGKIKPLYLRYLSAAFGSAMITSIYSIVDTAMVGQYHGPEGTAALAVVARGADDREALAQKADMLHRTFGAQITLVEGPVLEVSSTELRETGDFARLTPPEVAEYILENRLYQQL